MLIIDCAKMGKKPGSVYKYNLDTANLPLNDTDISLHGFGLTDILEMARLAGSTCQKSLVGIEPKAIAFNTGLSREVKEAIPTIIGMVVEEAKRHEQENTDN